MDAEGRENGTEQGPPAPRPALARLLNPRTIAFVGVSEKSRLAANARLTLESDAEVSFVHPTAREVFGRPAVARLADIDGPLDAVFAAVNAASTVEVARDAIPLGIGGLITIAAGFAEAGASGAALQSELADAADQGGYPVIGPNGVGMIDARRGTWLTMLKAFGHRPGGLSVVSHSGAMIGAIAAAAHRPGGPGLSALISAGNEAVTDVAAFLGHLADDERTSVILLALEKIRRPEAFFAAAARALERGKPVLALKLGRSQRAQRMAASHTGSMTGDAWVYEVALRQAGIQLVDDIDELVDRAQLLERLPRSKWSAARGVAVLTGTGGFAQLASDLAGTEDIVIPELAGLEAFVRENIPGGDVANPLDATGFASTDPGLWERIVRTYAAHPDVDTILYTGPLAEWDNRFLPGVVHEVATESGKPFVISPLAGPASSWASAYEPTVGIGSGLRSSLRGLGAMGAFMTMRRDRRVVPASAVPAMPPPGGPRHAVAEGSMLGFAAAMELVGAAGIGVAPYAIVADDEPEVDPGFDGPYVVKLADVPHRTEAGAVLVGVARADLAGAVRALREIAERKGLAPAVAVQPMLTGHGEAFIGIRGASELGPVVAFGVGGIFVEVLGRLGGRLAPVSRADAAELVAEFDDLGILDGHRGARAWDRDAVADAIVAAGDLAAQGRGWIETIDLNPLIVTDDGLVAVDALCLVRT
ncbi:MAG: acetate--CoA ligase family protein [Microbacterium sp.]